jgi:cytochrome b561
MIRTYTTVQKWLHWLHAAIILCALLIGLAIVRMGEGELTNLAYEAHKSLGILAFGLVLIRGVIRIWFGVPEPVESLPILMRVGAKLVHLALYGLILVVPMFGYAATSMCCKPVKLFGLITMPLDMSGSEALMKSIFGWHEALALILLALASAHILMALVHRFILKDGVFERMG